MTIEAILEFLTGVVFLLGGTAALTFAGGGSLTLYAFGTRHPSLGFSFLILGDLTGFYARRWVRTAGFALAVISIIRVCVNHTLNVLLHPFHKNVKSGYYIRLIARRSSV